MWRTVKFLCQGIIIAIINFISIDGKTNARVMERNLFHKSISIKFLVKKENLESFQCGHCEMKQRHWTQRSRPVIFPEGFLSPVRLLSAIEILPAMLNKS